MTQHQQPRDAYLSLRRFQTYFRDVIEPAVWSASAPLAAEVHQIADPLADPITAEAAAGLEFRPVSTPWRWGPKWSTSWFRVRGVIPASWKGRAVSLRFSSGTEGLVWRVSGRSATPASALQGMDVNRDAFHLTPSAAGGEAVEALIEAACNHPFGVTGFEWDVSEVHQRWNSPDPGHFDRCELAVFEPACWELRQRYAFALRLLEELPLDSNRAQELIAALRHATNALPHPLTQESALHATSLLRAAIESAASGSTTHCFAVGHAHLDTAWLWPIRETKRKVLRTFSNQLGLMERFPTYVFLASQTQHYAWVEERDPALFARIRQRVAEGRWEPGGGMWIEPDVNCVSGESLVRQMLHADRWWRSRFGEKGKQRFLFLPDTFGFGSNLPQLMRLAGLDTFITNKLHWWQHTTFPFTTFVWRGIDGSAVLGHNTPGQDYNAVNTPKELRRGEATHRNKSSVPPTTLDDPALARGARTEPIWLQPFGFGDGGGGATDWSIRFAEYAADCDGVPKVEFASASAFCDALHAQHRAGANFPEWSGELDMEMHRGTLTSQAWIKRANREAEESLRLAEMVLALLPLPEGGGSGKNADLDRAWKLALLNQFHDILPGSSIGWVYEDARKDYAEIDRLVRPIIDRGLAAIASDVPMVLNTTSRKFTGVVDVGGVPAHVVDVPPLGVSPIVPVAAPERTVVVARADTHTIKNHLTTAELSSATGDIQRFSVCKGLNELLAYPPGEHGFNLLAAPAGLRLYEDRPVMWDAWDIDHYYTDKPVLLGPITSTRVVEQHPLRSVVETTRQLSPRSTMTQRVTLHAGSGRLDLHFSIDWHEAHQLLRFEIPTTLGPAAICTHGTHFGHQTRPTHRNTAHERARFEFPVQGWLDVSEPGRGLAVLSDCKFGFSCWLEGGVHRLGVSLLRAPTHPDPQCDQGRHEFTISLLPHAGDWRAAGVVHQAELLRSPVRVIAANAGSGAVGVQPMPPFSIDCTGRASVTIAAFKHAEDSDDLILRLHECHGAAGPCRIVWLGQRERVEVTDLLERTEPEGGVRVSTAMTTHRGWTTTLDLRPFEIVTLRVDPGRKIQ
jgi:alpha-mannosidase